MNYGRILELDRVTPNQCLDAFELRGRQVVINDGRIIDFLEKDEDELTYWAIRKEERGAVYC